MVKEYGLDYGLKNINQEIISFDMGQFMYNDRLYLLNGQSTQHACRQQDYGFQYATDSGNLDFNGLKESDRLPDSRPGLQAFKTCQPVLIQGRNSMAAHTFRQEKSPCKPG